ncbi:glycosyl hydrolase catalytic core-domain-containing protein [Trametes maxima]|nr:glycosyl hydrolase catalytic core-domain-containing protein [Trametes maxima]
MSSASFKLYAFFMLLASSGPLVVAGPTGAGMTSQVAARSNPSFGKAGSKICLAWAEGNDPSLTNFKTSHVVGLHDYVPEKPSASDALGFDYWPTLWGGDQDKITDFENTVGKKGYGTIILGFNEPNEQGQANLDPVTAASLWVQHIEPKRSFGYNLASPAVSSRPNGQQWMQNFLQSCSGCSIDYIALHWHDTDVNKLKDYLTQYHNTFGKPILLTEFSFQNFNGGAQPTQSEVFSNMTAALKFFDANDWILAACPFGFLKGVTGPNALQNPDGTPSALGKLVINDGQ